MSHRKPRPRVKIACPACRRNLPPTPAVLLGQAADALNACLAAGLKIRLHGGAIECEEGLVLGPVPGSGYVARTRLYTEFPVPEGDDLDA